MKVIGCLLAAIVWISSQCCTGNEESAKKMANHRRITLEGMCEESEEAESESQKTEEMEWKSENQETEETEWESESQEPLTTEKDTENEMVTERESDSLPPSTTEEKIVQICVTDIWPSYEEGYKVYDGSDYVELEADVTGLLEGMHLEVWGVAEQAEAGCWQVDVQTNLRMEPEFGGEVSDYEVQMEETQMTITILPRPLTITISDGVKNYYEEPDLEEVDFLSEKGPVHVTGFVNDVVPEGFEMPELSWNPGVIKKESPMYRNGKRIEYKDAIVVKTDAQGKPTGNATANYCFVLDKNSGYYETGSIFLREPVLLGAVDYYVQALPEEGLFLDEQGITWIREGTSLQMRPQKENGFNTGTVTSALTESGMVALQLLKQDRDGQITASSYPQYIGYQVDAEPPTSDIGVEGTRLEEGEIIYRKNPVVCGILNMQDTGSGIRSIQICAVRGQNKEEIQPEKIYLDHPNLWQSGIQISLSEEGAYTVMVRLEDQVGNVRFVKSGLIIIDWTAPEMEIQGILPGSANNDKVEPLIFCQDEYYQEGSLSVILNGGMTGEKRFAQERTVYTYGEQIQIQDIPHEKRWDDLYVLQAVCSDMAGNAAEKKMIFSVNRFGSVYQLDGRSREKLDAYYMQEPTELVIWEFNVDPIMAEKIRVGHGQQVRTLLKGSQYRVAHQLDNRGWREYCYRISAENFWEEGAYYVMLETADRAENVTDSRSQRLKMEFAIDRTAPGIYVTGVEDGEQYSEEKRVAVIACQDNQRLEKVQIYLNDKLVAENRETQQTLEVLGSSNWQSLEIRAMDGAGNESVLGPVTFCVGKEKILHEEKKESSVSERAVKTEKTDAEDKKTDEKGVLNPVKKEISKSSEEGKNGVQIVIFLVISGILGGYLYKIKRVKE